LDLEGKALLRSPLGIAMPYMVVDESRDSQIPLLTGFELELTKSLY